MKLSLFSHALWYSAALAAPAVRVTNQTSSVSDLLDKVVAAMGGFDSFSYINGFSYQSSVIYRSQTLTQSYNLHSSDQSVAESGIQNISFAIVNDTLRERIDRQYRYNDYWIWAHANLSPVIDYTFGVQDDIAASYACFTKGSNNFFLEDPSQAQGYADSLLTDYLVHQAHQYALPWLISRFVANVNNCKTVQIIDPFTNISVPAIEHPQLSLTLGIDDETSLPHLVRSNEHHVIFGPSTSDLIFSNYSRVSLNSQPGMSMLLPHRMQTVYNSKDVIEDFVMEHVSLNPPFPDDFFDPLPEAQSQTPRSAAKQSPEYPRSEVHLFFEAGLWSGPVDPSMFNTSTVIAEHPMPDLPQVQSVYIGYADYVQLVVEFEDGVLITDAPAHRSKILIDWVKQTMNKTVTHIVPSHHHHDHASGVADYIAQGAILVVPEIAKSYYQNVNSSNEIKFATYTAEQPFILRDDNVQFRSLWRDENPHARDWSYGIVTKACPRAAENDSAVVFIADVLSPETQSDRDDGFRWDLGYARQWFNIAAQDGLPKSATVVCAHGGENTTASLQHFVDAAGFLYPELTVDDWKAGGMLCS